MVCALSLLQPQSASTREQRRLESLERCNLACRRLVAAQCALTSTPTSHKNHIQSVCSMRARPARSGAQTSGLRAWRQELPLEQPHTEPAHLNARGATSRLLCGGLGTGVCSILGVCGRLAGAVAEAMMLASCETAHNSVQPTRLGLHHAPTVSAGSAPRSSGSPRCDAIDRRRSPGSQLNVRRGRATIQRERSQQVMEVTVDSSATCDRPHCKHSARTAPRCEVGLFFAGAL